MNNKLTLDDVTPKMTFKQKVILGLILIAVAVVLAVSYFQTQINPFNMYEQRRNAFEYLFGRDITDSDRETARRQAERLPRVMAYEEAQHAIQQEYRSRGEKPDLAALAREAEKKTKEILAAMPPKDIETMVQEEYERIIDEKARRVFPARHRTRPSQSLLPRPPRNHGYCYLGKPFSVFGGRARFALCRQEHA